MLNIVIKIKILNIIMSTNCHWCYEKLSTNQKRMNIVQNYVACDYCLNTMCEICNGPCRDICENCGRVCHEYPCDDISSKCIGYCIRCVCDPKDGIETMKCNWCNKNLSNDEQEEHNHDSLINKLPICDKCNEKLCEECGGINDLNMSGTIIKKCYCNTN